MSLNCRPSRPGVHDPSRRRPHSRRWRFPPGSAPLRPPRRRAGRRAARRSARRSSSFPTHEGSRAVAADAKRRQRAVVEVAPHQPQPGAGVDRRRQRGHRRQQHQGAGFFGHHQHPAVDADIRLDDGLGIGGNGVDAEGLSELGTQGSGTGRLGGFSSNGGRSQAAGRMRRWSSCWAKRRWPRFGMRRSALFRKCFTPRSIAWFTSAGFLAVRSSCSTTR